MKFIILLSLVIICIAIPSLKAAKVCVIQTSTCSTDTTNVCGRYGRSTLCKRFKNNCALQMANCADNVGYTLVNATNCRNIALNKRAVCGSSSSSSSNVTPIIISAGK